jgi:peptide-methionine (S)-S-oxide reductase
MSARTERATFGAGCFWCVQLSFDQVKGVKATEVGYMGGRTESPTYRDVCSHKTGHAEVVDVTFDPEVLTYEQLLDVFWGIHDPTTLNRQGPDVGDQYRSSIFYYSPEQKALAELSKKRAQASGRFRGPIVTEIVPAKPFWKAEEYHQKYLEKKGQTGCHI